MNQIPSDRPPIEWLRESHCAASRAMIHAVCDWAINQEREKAVLEAQLKEAEDVVKYYADMDLWEQNDFGFWVHGGKGPRKAEEALEGLKEEL